jgi:hypothetical protein
VEDGKGIEIGVRKENEMKGMKEKGKSELERWKKVEKSRGREKDIIFGNCGERVEIVERGLDEWYRFIGGGCRAGKYPLYKSVDLDLGSVVIDVTRDAIR